MNHEGQNNKPDIERKKSERILSPRGAQFQNAATFNIGNRYVEPQEGGFFKRIFNTGTHAGRADLMNAVFVLVAVLVGVACLVIAHINGIKYRLTHQIEEMQKTSSSAKGNPSPEASNMPQSVTMDDQIDMMNSQIEEIKNERALRKKLRELKESAGRQSVE